ncbi:hypothetical protein FG386_002277 [Cryptosporidium ryanae]|uniref:uncharacterized protein n=1 Tax=Cryptosporidium ryanae TaxID=515981 RepID=UPI00351A14D3|nr:hypothetical protein FG386_002277 [Cryptosporidium ryanae]
MSDTENTPESEKLNDVVYYNGEDKDVYTYIKYFERNFPLSYREIEDEATRENIESDYNYFISVVTSFLIYEWDVFKDLIRIERNLSSLTNQDLKLYPLRNIENEIDKYRSCIRVNQNFFKLMLSPDLYFQIAEAKNRSNLNKSKFKSKNKYKAGVRNKTQEISNKYKYSSVNNSVGTSGNTDVRCNSEDCLCYSFKNEKHDEGSCYANGIPNTTIHNLSKAKATLRQFVRDWSEHGETERSESYDPILKALVKYLPLDIGNPRRQKVLVPGAGLGRLLFEVAKLGYSCQGNEISYAMLLGSNFILNYMFEKNSIRIYPYLFSLSNRSRKEDNLRPVFIPDVCINEYVKYGHDFSMCAGEFVEVYSSQMQIWDAVLTCFFLDTAKNIITYIRTIINLIPPNGVWINLGPLLYHYSGMNDVVSIELSWEEIREIISNYFDIVEEEWKDATYTRNNQSMFKIVYKCIFFVAIRNQVPLVDH